MKNLRNGYFASNLILKNDLSKITAFEAELGIFTKRSIEDKDVDHMAMNEYLTRIALPGGAHPEEDSFEKVFADYQTLSKFQHPDIEFCLFESESMPGSYFFWMIDRKNAYGQRCFSWGGPGISR